MEMLIVDDASPTRVHANQLGPLPEQVSLRVLRQTTSCGPAAARNRGIVESRGPWIAFLDDDDAWAPRKIQKQLNALRATPSSDTLAAACQMRLVDDHQRQTGQTNFPADKQQIVSGMVFADRNLNPSTLLVARQAFTDVGLFDPELPTAEDREWLLRYLIQYDIIVMDEYLTDYTQHSGPSLTTNFDAMLRGEARFAEFIREHSGRLGVDHRRAMAYRFAKLGNEYMLAAHWLPGLWHFVKAIAMSPREHRAWAGLTVSLLGTQLYRRVMSLRMTRVRLAS
jgi:glycosyltransferase involved in cell wall biosynthesis